MTLTVMLNLSSEMEAELRQSIDRHDAEKVRQLLADALTPVIEELLLQGANSVQDEKWETIAEQLIEEVAVNLSANIPPLSDYAVSRDGIYES